MITKFKLYIVEDDNDIINLLKSYFENNYDIYITQNFRDISNEVENIKPDLILMDITLPFFNGFYWTTEIRKKLTTPIIFISSSNDELDMVMALDMGGDDFISKPFSLQILNAKIAAFLRRSQSFTQNMFEIDGYTLDRDGVLTKDNQSVHLTPTENKILSVLLTHRNEIVSKENLLATLWDSDDFIDHNTLSVNLARLRKKIIPIGFDKIQTIRGVGYLLK
ncbi:MAG: response regulator transcription factor [Streptococcus sp.]|nr:response regulator transcription factor [Streptococcus sp.]